MRRLALALILAVLLVSGAVEAAFFFKGGPAPITSGALLVSPGNYLLVAPGVHLKVHGPPSAPLILPSYNDASANWKMAGMQSAGGIPNRTTICATVSPIGGGSSDATNIQNAINSCPAGQVVQLGAGTFTMGLNTTLTLGNGVTLRGCTVTSNCALSQETDDCSVSSGTGANGTIGAGANFTGSPYCATIIDSSAWGAQVGQNANNGCNGSGCIPQAGVTLGLAYPSNFGWTAGPTLTADAAQGATTISVASTSGLSVGNWVLITEGGAESWQADPSAGSGYAPGGQIWAASDWSSSSGSLLVNGVQSATGRVSWQLHNPGLTGDDGISVFCNYGLCTGACTSVSNCESLATQEIHRIASIGSGTITFDSPLTIAYRQSGDHNAQIFTPSLPFVQNAGIENLTIKGASNGGLDFVFCAYCWAKGVEVNTWYAGGVIATNSARIEVNKDFVHHYTWPESNGAEYAINFIAAVTEGYVVNSIAVLDGKAMTERESGGGNVFAYNYFDQTAGDPSPGWQEMGANGSHLAGAHQSLFEGNWTQNIDNDSTHGSEFYHTFFRNLSPGLRSPFFDPFQRGFAADCGSDCSGKIVSDWNGAAIGGAPLRAFGSQEYNYWNAAVGNVLGTSGVTVAANGFQLNTQYANNGANQNPGIWFLGWRDVVPQPVDANVATRTFRHGNYDYFDNQLVWDAGTSNHNLPNSLYLASSPSFFTASSCTWPWVNPAGVTKFNTLPAKMRMDAGTPFTAVTCGAAPTDSISATQTTLAFGNTDLLTWQSSNAASCAGTNFSTGSSPPSGSAVVSPASTTTYTVTCGSATPASVTITVTGGGFTTFDPTGVSGDWTLSNTNETATQNASAGGNDRRGRSTTSQSSGSLYAEFQCNTVDHAVAFGLWDGTGTASTYLGGDTSSAGFYADGAFGYSGSFPAGVWSGCVAGDTVGLEVNPTAHTASARTKHSGVWGSFSAAQTIPSGALYLAASMKSTSSQVTLCSGTLSCGVGPLPSGYSWWQ